MSFSASELQQFVIETELLLSCGPIVFLREGQTNPLHADSNGTFGLVDTGTKRLLVTCWHVWEGFERFRRKHHTARIGLLLGIGFPVLLPNKPPIASDKDMDLAVFDMEELISYTGKRRFFPLNKFPPERARPRDVVAFLGYAGEGKQLSESVGNFRYSFFGLSVTAVSSSAFMITRGDDKRRLLDNSGHQVADFELKGISGSPCYRLSRSPQLELVGFVKAGQSTESSLFVAHASFIQPDGTLRG